MSDIEKLKALFTDLQRIADSGDVGGMLDEVKAVSLSIDLNSIAAAVELAEATVDEFYDGCDTNFDAYVSRTYSYAALRKGGGE